MQGLHLTADLAACAPGRAELTDARALLSLCRRAVREAGLQAVGDCYHGFPADASGRPGGITCVLLLAESHLAVHTWPELGRVTLDIYVCHRHADNSARAESVIAALLAAFAPGEVKRQRLERG